MGIRNKTGRARMLIRWRRWKKRVMNRYERLSKTQEAAIAVAKDVISDRENTLLEHCPMTFKRVATRGGDTVMLIGSSIIMAGKNYYYVVGIPSPNYDDVERMFDLELAKYLNRKHRRVLSEVNAGIGSILAKVDEPDYSDK